MAAANFPNNPVNGDTVVINATTYVYNSTNNSWDIPVGAGLTLPLTSLSVGTEGTPSGDGELSYDNTTGVFTYTPPVISEGGSISLTATLNSSDWTQATTEDPWIATKTVSGILTTDRLIVVDIDLSSVALLDIYAVETSWSNLYRGEISANDQMKFYATNQPTSNFNLLITGAR
jgi:hypothetical protein